MAKLRNLVIGMLAVSQITIASPSSELNHFFNNLGFASNVTGAHAYQTQAAGYISSGSMYVRNQVRNIQIAHVDVPGFRTGCGSIDIIAGGFSFISTDQITQFMQSILSSGAGYALNLALETELPEVAHSMQFVQKLANDINSSNLNSCDIGETLGGALWPKNRAEGQRICEDIGMKSGYFADWARARHGCSTGGEVESQLSKAKNDPTYKDRVPYNKNVVWDALQLNQFLRQNKKLAEAYMSISGTVVFDKQGALTTYPSLIHNRDFIKAMLYGGKLPSYKCNDIQKDSACIDVSYSENTNQIIEVKDSIVFKVQELIQGIHDNIRAGTALSAEQEGLINMTHDSVFRLIAANAQEGISIQGSYALAQNIATDILSQYLSNSLSIIRSSLSGHDIGANNQERLLSNLQEAQRYVEDFSKESRARFNQSMQTNTLIHENVKQAFSALSPLLQSAYKEGVRV
ncbi:putative conjugative transfer protein TraH [Legionella busanensis]|uniref:Putative conjugative transfer protein TraH n=1 Tax=Legionella busanensis TaxID=190655 RepID=A0A378K976_9GAMM|nr:conjugal transfer protein TraH [Legionella busanensis]STX81267.1 putative conjugative transfer protein TraH [Legionella busanensis]